MPETVDEIRMRVAKAQDNYMRDLSSVEDVLERNRGYVTRAPECEHVIVICSGGLDSTIMISKIIEEWDVKVHPLFFRRGQKNLKYEEAAFDFFNDLYTDMYPKHLAASYKMSCDIPPSYIRSSLPEALSKTIGHPLRNSTMQNVAVMYAVSLNGRLGLDIRTVLTGSVGDDNTEPELGILSLRSQNVMTCISMADWRWQITSPFIDPDITSKEVFKSDLIRYAVDNSLPLDRTRSCFGLDELACGKCNACTTRLKAFETVGLKDPLGYKVRD